MPSFRPSAPSLLRLFRQYNRKYFGNILPADTVVRWGSQKDFGKYGSLRACWGVCWYDEETELPVIELHPDLRDRRLIQTMKGTLIHECVHLAVGDPNHGQTFDNEMLRVAKLGALHKIW